MIKWFKQRICKHIWVKTSTDPKLIRSTHYMDSCKFDIEEVCSKCNKHKTTTVEIYGALIDFADLENQQKNEKRKEKINKLLNSK